MFEFMGETDNIIKFSCLMCLAKKNVLAFANSPSDLRQHVEVRTESYSVLHGPGLGPRAGPARSPWTGPGQVSIIVCGPGAGLKLAGSRRARAGK